jgi:hypothetical protein
MLPPGAWEALVRWLLEREGWSVDEREGWSVDERAVRPVAVDRVHVSARSEGRSVHALAVRLPGGLLIGDDDVREAAADGLSTLDVQRILISPSPASLAAQSEALRLGVRLLDREALASWLDSQAEFYAHERERTHREAQMQAEAATAVRAALLAQLGDAERALVAAANSRRAAGMIAVGEARAQVLAGRQDVERTFLAWDTLLAEWSRAFDERPSRDGQLSILLDPVRFAELETRARHLGSALVSVCDRMAVTPGDGALGYGAWRRATLEHLTARCEALRWRALALDPAHWRSFTAAHDTPALERALAADTLAAHALARVAKAAAAMEERVGMR